MSIAQRLVAGEKFAQPTLSTDPTNLKWKTLRAEHRAIRMAALPVRARSLLAVLAQTVSIARPNDKIFASRATLCDRAQLSERSLFRALVDLDEAGLIRRHEQWSILGPKGFNRAYIQLTHQAIALLGFVDDDNTVPAKPSDKPRSARLADPYKGYLNPTQQERQPGQLPADLERLLDLGVLKNMVFKLMGEATRAGKRLSDVVENCWQGIKQARAPIAYLRRLIHSNVDFTHQTRQRRMAEEQEKTKTMESQRLMQVFKASVGQSFVDPRGTVLTLGEASVEVRVAGEGRPRYAAGQALFDVARGVASGSLRPWCGGTPEPTQAQDKPNFESLSQVSIMRRLLARL